MNRKSIAGFTGAALLAAGLATTLSTPATAAPQINAGALTAMQRDLGLTEAQALRRLARETQAGAAERALRGRLGAAYGGAWFDASTSTLVVGVTDAGKAGAVTAAGAAAQVVDDSLPALNSAKAVLDAASAPASVHGWYVDVTANALVVEVAAATAAAERFAAKAAATGVDVRTVRAEQAQTFYDVRGGDAWYTDSWRCSVGFSATGVGGTKHFVTAGHCTERPATTAYGYNRVALGVVGGSTFGRKGDFGKVDVTSASWVLKGTVNSYGGADVAVRGSSEAPVGASVCRSGSTTGWHCGVIQAKNQTVRYQGSGTVGGLTRTTVCAEPGDSGGAYISGNQAQGLTSGGSGNCRTGGTTFFQPVNEALSAYRLSLVTS